MAQEIEAEIRKPGPMKPITVAVILIICLAVVAAFGVRVSGVVPEGDSVTVVHWTNGHLTRDGLLNEMSARFNADHHKTASGKNIVVKVYRRDSVEQTTDLYSRVSYGNPIDASFPDPAIISSSADHWLVSLNQQAKTELGHNIIDLKESLLIAYTWVGVVTYRDMAECLGWPTKEIGLSDIISLRNHPDGWASYPCAKAEWGKTPLVSYTNPRKSSTGRSVLYALYGIAAGKPLDQLTVEDVNNPAVVDYVKKFQLLVDHYLPTTLLLNSRVHQGPNYGHFFLMPEDNLYHLYTGGEEVNDPMTGREVTAQPISRQMVMLYPKEGAAIHNHSASFVQAPWVSLEQREAAQEWVDYLRLEPQQRSFMAEGFRPGVNLPLACPICGKYGMDPNKPSVVLNTDRVEQSAADAVIDAWGQVKRASIVTWVLDTSGSMQGGPLEQAKQGMIRALDNMAENNLIGFLTFSNGINARIGIAPLRENKFVIAEEVSRLQAAGGTALYDAIKTAVEVTDSYPAPEAEARIRAVVVLTDGKANQGQTTLDALITMSSNDEVPILRFTGMEDSPAPVNERLRSVEISDLSGTGLKLPTRHNVQIFFIGIGDADLNVGRVLSQATGAEFQEASEKNLPDFMELFSEYF